MVALTHDPRIDDLAMMEAVRTEAFYIGVMGSLQTSQKRFERLRRIGGLGETELARIHAPIGLNLGSKTPAEIALAVLANALLTEEGSGPHIWVGYALAGLLGLRLFWGVVGPAEARFTAFWPSPRKALAHLRDIRSKTVIA